MRIIGICASPRGKISRTRLLVQQVLNGSNAQGAEVEFIDLCSLSIGCCTGCEACTRTGTCVLEDDLPAVLDPMIGAEGVVLGSPVYIDNVTAQMKAFIDRLADAIHYQVLTGAYGCSVATTWGSGGNEVVAYLDHVLHYLGAQTITGLSVSLGDNESALPQARVQAWECGKNLVETIQHQRRFPDQEKIITENREFFARIVKENRYSRPREYREWVKKGWIPEE